MTDRIHLDQVNIVVSDMEASVSFYRRLGLDIDDGGSGEWAPWAPHHRNSRGAGGADVDLDSPAFASQWNQGWPGGTGAVLNFRVPNRGDVDRLYDELTGAGYTGQQEPYDAFWGARFAVVADPDGNSVGLMSPQDGAMRAAPPLPPDSPAN